MGRFGALPANLVSFCRLLRRDYGFRIGAGELVDAARGLDVVNLADQQAVRSVLRTVLAGSKEDVAVFDVAFDRFFLSNAPPGTEAQGSGLQDEAGGAGEEDRQVARERTPPSSGAGGEVEEAAGGAGPMVPLETTEEKPPDARIARASYSPADAESREAPDVPEVDEAWVRTARMLVQRLQLGPSRKWRPTPRGRRFDFRRTLRSSLQTGGESLSPRWLARPRLQPRFIVLIDGSRSMRPYVGAALKVASALACATSRIEVFTFSTALQRVTSDVRCAPTRAPRRLHLRDYAWGGGTAIGACLADFLRRFGERQLAPSAMVIVASDGLDVGEPETLRAAVQTLRRRSGAFVWLNPLLETPGYEPTAVGMRAARPFVTTFTVVNDLADFVRLSRSVHLRL